VLVVLALGCGAAAGASAPPSKVHVGISASFVRSCGGALWVTDRTDNRVIRVDPVAGRVDWRVAVADRPFGLAYGAGSVWVGSRDGSRVTRLKASTKRRQARIRVGASPYALAFGGGSVWVSNEGSGTVSRIGPKRNKVVKTIRVGGQPNGIAVAFRKVWVADYGRGRLIRIDPVRNRVERRISLPKADWITASADALWVSSETGEDLPGRPGLARGPSRRHRGRQPARERLGRRQALCPEHRRRHGFRRRPGHERRGADYSGRHEPLAVAEAAGSAWITSDFDGDLWRVDP
jgi:YVTN family beta-propeller protein